MNFTRPFVAYAVTIFLSAFLLFEIEPIAGKFLLPAFGGTAAVWTTALLFFTGVLFLGYAYAYILSLYELRIQARVQVLALSAGILFVLVELGITHALHADLNYFLVLNPVSAVLITLFTSIGIPFFLLATTGPLLQQWYGVTYDSEPYRLYAFSNAGSLIALCAYPFFVEPFITLSHQQITWGIFFILFACVCAALSISQASTSKHVTARPVQRFDRSTLEKKLMWIVLSALPTCMLIATTTHLTRLIAPIPLLWLVLLGVYLITFIIAFTGIRIPYISVFVIAISGVSFSFLNPSPHDIAIVVVADVVLLWSVGTLCNQELYRLRPGSQEPALFYVFVSFGSLIGAVIASVIAPLIFSDYWEFPMGIVISMIVAAYILLSQHARISYTARYATIISLALVLIVPLLWYIGHHNDTKLYVARNFYGTVKIYDIEAARILLNGSTLHGLQRLATKQLRHSPG